MAVYWILYSDLDGTLLDHKSYSMEGAEEALAAVRRRGIPLVLCSSKTRSEMEAIRGDLGLADPFIVENGGAVILPRGYFPSAPEGFTVSENGWSFVLGRPYGEIRRALLELARETGVRVRGYGDLSDEDVSKLTGLGLEEARRSREREFDEPFILDGGTDQEKKLVEAAGDMGFRITRGGRLFHLTGENDKGKAVQVLTGVFQKFHENVVTIGIGDSLNDLPMLEAVDHPVLVQKPGGGYQEGIRLPGLERARGVGPEGWSQAVLKLIGRPSRR